MIPNFIVDNTFNRFVFHVISGILLFIILLFSDVTYVHYSKIDLNQKQKLQFEYKWLNSNLYELYFYRSKQFKVDLKLALSVIKVESNGKRIRGYRQNKNGTYDWGRFQINEVHHRNNPRGLLNDKLNSYYGFYYLSRCIKKSKGNYKQAIRMYNQGLSGKRKYYKNWKYVNRILNYYASI